MLTGAIAGLTAGGIYAVLAVCLTLMARLVRVVNFAQVMVGGLAVYVASALHSQGMPYLAGALIGVLISVALSCVLGLIMVRWFAEAGTDRRSAVSIAALVGILAASYLVFGSHPRPFVNLISGSLFTLHGVAITTATLVILAIAFLLAIAGHFVLSRTSIGLRLRALSERPTTAELIGVRTSPLTVAVWAVLGLAVAVVVILAAPTLVSDQATLGLLVVPGCAAALVGGFRRLDLALVGGLGLGVLQGALAQISGIGSYQEAIPFVLILAVLMWSQRKEVWDVAR